MGAPSQPDRDKHSEELEHENERLRKELERALSEIERLRKELEAALRANKGQAAPFSKGKRVTEPKLPGRKPGKGVFRHRMEPAAEEVRVPPVEVPVALTACPDCGGSLELEGVDLASVTDLPTMPRPEATLYRVEVCRCLRCGRRVRGRHPALAADQQGATAHRLGPRVMAVAHALHYGVGVPVRRVPAIMRELTGIRITQGAITQDALRRAQGVVGAAYEELRATVREAPVIYTDDTGWRVGGQPAHLMVFDTDRATVYQIRPQHRNEEVRELVPSDYAGVLVTDRGKSYEARELEEVAQQKCVGHIQRNVSDVVEAKSGRGRSFGLRLKGLLRAAVQLWHERPERTAADFKAQARRINQAVTNHLRDRVLTDGDNQRLLDGIGMQHDQGRLLRFLQDPTIEPTNNRSERSLRPAVIARKLSHCSKNDKGAEAFAAFTSVLRTRAKNGCVSLVEALHDLLSPLRTQHSP